MTNKEVPKGIRLNNPGNLEMGSPWQGLTKQPQDKRFCSFTDPSFGIRAIAVTLITYHDKRKAKDGSRIDTVREVIERWAPSVENHTENYIKVVCRAMGVLPDQNIDLHKYHVIRPLVEAIIFQENGRGDKKNINTWYSADVIDEGLRRGGIVKPVKEIGKIPVTKETASATVAATLGVGQLAEIMPQISDAFVKSESHLSSGSIVRVIFGVATIAVACVIAYAQVKRYQKGFF